MPRNTYLVCYDICDDKRLKTVYKTMRDFGDHLQYSIFECQFTPTDLAGWPTTMTTRPVMAPAPRSTGRSPSNRRQHYTFVQPNLNPPHPAAMRGRRAGHDGLQAHAEPPEDGFPDARQSAGTRTVGHR